MKFKIYFTIDDNEDYFIIEEDSIVDIKNTVELEISERNLDQVKNNMWSEEIDD